ncbi:MAG: TetR/AcrR family transcriptional regulator [Paracoccaceae bacterium]|nr:TetR/AcrR family transcriptional regulator [Paracoccaceae bacterium]
MAEAKHQGRAEFAELAMQAFWARGYEGTSMGDLVTVTGMNRGSIYARFSGKHEVFMTALAHYDEVHRARFLAILVRDHGARAAILAAFDAAARPVAKGHPKGCLLVNTAIERSPHDAEVAAFVRASLDAVGDFFRGRLQAARDAGEIAAGTDTDALGHMLLGLFLGLRVLARSGADCRTTDAITAQAKALMG